MPEPSPLAEILSALGSAFGGICPRWYVFGAQAVQVWGTPRLSADVDVTVELPSDNTHALVSAVEHAGFALRVRDVDDFVRRTRVLPFVHRNSGMFVDVVLAGPGPEEEFLARARSVEIAPGLSVPIISPEDLVATKILAGRPKDIEDVRGILRSRGSTLDIGRIRRLLGALEGAVAQTDLLSTFEAEMARARGQ